MGPLKNKPKIPTPLVPSLKSLPRIEREPDGKISFSFSHWCQIENFGLNCDHVDINWISALLSQLKNLSGYTVEQVTSDPRLAKAIRYHPIDWEDSRTTISKEHIWELIPKEYRNDEYEIAQFQISISKGRIIGFFDHKWVFRVILLDPMHNMILSKKPHDPNYKIRGTTDLLTPYQKIENQILAIRSEIDEICPETNCKVGKSVNEALHISSEKLFICLEDYCDGEVLKKLGEKFNSIDDLILQAFDLLHEKLITDESSS